MSVRNLDKLFKPRSVALIGATDRAGSVGAVVLRNLRRAGFQGELLLVNPHRQTLDGLPVYPDVASLPCTPDLAIIVTPTGHGARPDCRARCARHQGRGHHHGWIRRTGRGRTRLAAGGARRRAPASAASHRS